MVTGGLIGLKKSLVRWTPCRALLKRRFAQERPTSNDDDKANASAAADATSGSQQAHQVKATTQEETNPDPDPGEIATPSLLKATSTKDFLISLREVRLREKEKGKDEDADVTKLAESFRKGASTTDLDSG